jgi:uncharacterized RDD family membrane protein YckC
VSHGWVSQDGSEIARYARQRQRALAGAADWAICLVLYILVSFPAGIVQAIGGFAGTEGAEWLEWTLLVVSQAMVAGALVAYFALGLRSGQTLGMRAVEVHARVVSTGHPPGTLRSIVRAVFGLVFALAFVNAYFGWRGTEPVGGISATEQAVFEAAVVIAIVAVAGKLWAFVDPERRSLWDRLFGLVYLEDLDSRDPIAVGYSSWLRQRARTPS